ncbi:MAG TPA: ATP-binding protein [Geobacteraceae bacterium]|nr:ATP-binding protein [Geobacteraceae bacterium]
MKQQTLQMEARLENLPAILGFAGECAARAGFSAKRLAEVELVIEEAVVNICKYAYPAETGLIEITCRGDRTSLCVRITDTGVPFDLLAVAEPDLYADISDRRIGGLGCYLIKTLADEVTSRRDGDRNVLELSFLAERTVGKETGDD